MNNNNNFKGDFNLLFNSKVESDGRNPTFENNFFFSKLIELKENPRSM